VEIRNPNLLDEAEEPETDTIYRTMRILNLNDGLRVTKAGMRLSADSDCNEQRAGCLLSFCYKLLRGDIFSECFFHGTFSDTSAVSYSKVLDLKMVYVSSFITFMRHDFATSINIHIPFVLSQIRISGLCYGRFCRFILFGSKLLPYNHGLFLLISVNGQAGVHFLILHHFHCTCHSLVNSNYFMPTNV